MPNFNYQMSALGPALEIMIFDKIGGDDPRSVSAADVVRDVNAFKGAEIHFLISSTGGFIFDAMAIYAATRNHSARVTTTAIGVVASAAVIVYLAGDEREISEGCELMVHRASNVAQGDVDSLRHSADTLEQVEADVVSLMSRRTGISEDEMKSMMDRETWLDADKSVRLGFATSKVSDNNKLKGIQMSIATRGSMKPNSMVDLIKIGGRRKLPQASTTAPRKPSEKKGPTCLQDLIKIR